MRFYLFIASLLVYSFSWSQQVPSSKVLFKKSAEYYDKTQQYAFSINYKLFDDSSSKVIESYDGEIVKNYQQLYYKIKDFEIVNFSDFGVKVSQSEKIVLVYKQNFKQNFLSPLNLEKYMNGFISKVTSNGNYWVCTLTPAKGSQVMANSIIVYINKENYTISKQEIFMLSQFQSNNSNKKKPQRMVVTFNKRLFNKSADVLKTTKSNYFTGVGKQMRLSKRYTGFKLIQG